MDNKGAYQDFASNILCLKKPKNFAGDFSVLCLRKLPVVKKIMDKRREYQVFSSKNFCLTVPKNFVGEPFCAVFQKNSGSEKD